MRILAVDTATQNCSAALLIDGRLLAREERSQRGHAARIVPMIDELLAEAALALTALDAIAFGRGPGAFTGVRLAAGIAQGLAFGAGLPVVPISDLRALAQRVFEAASPTRVLICNDARMHEVYWACFERAPQGWAEPAGAEHVGPPASVHLPDGWADGVHGAGSGFDIYPRLSQVHDVPLAAVQPGLLPRAREIAGLAALEVAAGRALPAEEALPVYLRDAVTWHTCAT